MPLMALPAVVWYKFAPSLASVGGADRTTPTICTPGNGQDLPSPQPKWWAYVRAYEGQRVFFSR